MVRHTKREKKKKAPAETHEQKIQKKKDLTTQRIYEEKTQIAK